jgi:hypothetical protein
VTSAISDPAGAMRTGTSAWTFSGALRYQSGQLIRVPAPNNGLFRQLARTDNPAIWGGANTHRNRNAGQNVLLVDPHCHCFDPTTTRVLNAALRGSWAPRRRITTITAGSASPPRA